MGNAQGNGGTIALKAPKVTVSGGATVVANTESQGNAGSIGITATDMLIDGNGSGVGSQVLTNAKGNGGTIVLKVPQVSLSNGATITADNQGQGNAGGNIEITSRSIRLDGSSIVSKTTSGNGGNLTLTAQDFLLLRRNSQISTTAGTAQAGGNGGRINIDTNFIIAVPGENSDITANAFSGEGGKVTINGRGIFFVEPKSRQDLEQQLGTTNPTQLDPSQLPTNDITAISQENPNLSGQVSINTPDLDPSKGLVALPTLVVDTSKVIETGNCAALNSPQGNTFTITGRGGLPPSPYEPLSSDVVWSDTRLTNIRSGDRSTSSSSPKKPVKTSEKIVIVPATGWVFNGKGQVTLISHASGATPERLGTATSCIQP
ncbi:S-layer family protein [Tolypothrix campylonemoides VB511288]|nr:S-layer family protein [Tolypothrix campylonemoides VB511288]